MNIFCHANGFPPATYKSFLTELGEIKTIDLLPLKQASPTWDLSWHDYTTELIKDIEKLGQPVTGIGHSMGGICLLEASVLRPDLFNKLILIDPTLLLKRFIWLTYALPLSINRKIHPVASKAYRRKDVWDSKDEIFTVYRKKKLFKYFSDEVLWEYIANGFVKKENKWHLVFTKEWEEFCFLKVINAWPLLKKSTVSIEGIVGEYSDLMTKKVIARWKKFSPTTKNIHTVKSSGHLLPFERPNEVANLVKSLI
jgi:pimeloyl-ACP methyl ester carboxylesterase